MLVLKILPRLSKSAAFSRPKLRGTPTSPPRKPPMPHDDGSATDRASAWRARKNRRRLHTACSEPARANCSVCLRLHWVGAFFLFLATAVAALTGLPGCQCAGNTALAPTTTPNGRVPAPSDCGLANRRRLHTVCSEPARASCSVCLRLHWVGAFFLFLATAQQWLPGRVCSGARAALLWHPLERRMVEYQHQVIVDLQTGVDCTQRAVSPPGRTAACATLCLWRVGAFSKKKGWSALLLAPTQVTAPEAGDSHTGADCTHVVESWNRAHSDTMQ